jgi:hypothetical protein
MEFSAMMILAHLLGDFVWQTDFMAQNKTKYNWVAALHAAVYTVAIGGMLFPQFWYSKETAAVFALKLLIVFITHYLMDRYSLAKRYMQLVVVDQKGFAEHLKPWSTIIVDNTGHLLVLALLWHPAYLLAN